jgi:hypothetical protein
MFRRFVEVLIKTLNIMKTIRISKTVFPKDRPENFNQWSMWFWGLYAQSIEKSKNDWSRNEYKPKNK